MPLVLCHVEGLRHEEVARRIGCPVGTVESRLSRARERLRMRLARRGLAPSASAMAAMLRPPGMGAVRSSLVESTVRAATSRLGVEATLGATAASLLVRVGRAAATGRRLAGTTAAVTVMALGITAVGLGFVGVEKPPPPPTTPPPVAAAPVPLPTPPESRRTPQAVARPLSGITIDGRLDDWPAGLPTYPIRSVLTTMPDQLSLRIPEGSQRP